jgi:hypothetical protein
MTPLAVDPVLFPLLLLPTYWLVLSVAFWVTARVLPTFKIAGIGWTVIIAAGCVVVDSFFGQQTLWKTFSVLIDAGVNPVIALWGGVLAKWILVAITLKTLAVCTRRISFKTSRTVLLVALITVVIGWYPTMASFDPP